MNKELETLSEIIGSCNTKCDHPFDCSHCKAIRVHNAGYRKASDVAREIFESIKENCVDEDGYFLYGAFMNLQLDTLKKCESEENK